MPSYPTLQLIVPESERNPYLPPINAEFFKALAARMRLDANEAKIQALVRELALEMDSLPYQVDPIPFAATIFSKTLKTRPAMCRNPRLSNENWIVAFAFGAAKVYLQTAKGMQFSNPNPEEWKSMRNSGSIAEWLTRMLP